jgi:hypothetical protein
MFRLIDKFDSKDKSQHVFEILKNPQINNTAVEAYHCEWKKKTICAQRYKRGVFCA